MGNAEKSATRYSIAMGAGPPPGKKGLAQDSSAKANPARQVGARPKGSKGASWTNRSERIDSA